MAERIAVTKETVKAFLDNEMDGTNYHLMYGLHLLSSATFKAIMDALLNGELAVEELNRMGGFTDAEAHRVLRDALGNWVSDAVAAPNAGMDGFKYLTETLQLRSLLVAENATTKMTTSSSILRSKINVGNNGHASLAEAEAIFRTEVLDNALDGKTLQEYLPQTDEEIGNLPIANSDVERRTLLQSLYKDVYPQLIDEGATSVLIKLLQVGHTRSLISVTPAVLQWVMDEARPSSDVRLHMYREAAERTVSGQFTEEDIITRLNQCEASFPKYIGTGRMMSQLDFKLTIIEAAAAHHFSENEALSERILIVKDAYDALFNHRDRLRTFISNVMSGCQERLIGSFPMK